MHEHSFIEAIIKPIKNKGHIELIELEVGELAGIESEHLKKHLIEKTNWKVEIKNKKSKIKCNCGYKGNAKILQRLHDTVIFECPKCGNAPEVIGGKDIKIIRVTYREF